LHRWPDLEIHMDLEYAYMKAWITGRLEYLDRVFLAN
jgi:hypothetical protein